MLLGESLIQINAPRHDGSPAYNPTTLSGGLDLSRMSLRQPVGVLSVHGPYSNLVFVDWPPVAWREYATQRSL
jgi:hypothetical protein